MMSLICIYAAQLYDSLYRNKFWCCDVPEIHRAAGRVGEERPLHDPPRRCEIEDASVLEWLVLWNHYRDNIPPDIPRSIIPRDQSDFDRSFTLQPNKKLTSAGSIGVQFPFSKIIRMNL